MKKIVFLAVITLFTMSCNNSSNQNKNQEPIAGNDRDKHGCIGSAGQSWSELRQDCIQVFNEATRLNPMQTDENQAVISAFILFNDDKTKAEIFLPNDEKNIILEKTSESTFEKEAFTYDEKTGTLFIHSKETYKK